MNDAHSLTAADLAAIKLIECTNKDAPSAGLPYRPELDWSGVPASVVAEAKEAAERIRGRHRAVIDSILETGADLLRIKDKLGHGKFGPWVDAEFGWTARTAENYMAVAREFGSNPEVARLMRPGVLYQLAAKSTPASLRQEIITEAKTGTAPGELDIKHRIAQAKGAARTKTRKTTTATSGGSDASSSQEADTTTLVSTSGPDAVMSSTTGTDPISTEVTRSAKEPPSAEDAIETDREREEQEKAAKVVRFLQKKLGDKYARFCTEVQGLTPSVFMEALRAAPPIPANVKGGVIDLSPEDYSSASH